MRVSVIIPVLNEEKWLKGCLDHIASQTYPPDEVLVGIDRKTTDKSAEIAEAHPIVSRVIYEAMDTFPVQHQLVLSATGDIIVNCDGDTYLSENWIELGIETLKPDVSLVGGYIRPHNPNPLTLFIAWFNNNINPLYFPGCSAMFRREDYLKLKLENRYAEIPWFRFRELGKIVKNPEMIASTRLPTHRQVTLLSLSALSAMLYFKARR